MGETPDRDKQREEESEAERLDRELIELLNELRVAMPGVQVLFGFLLTVPFAQRFEEITAFQRHVYFVTLLLAAASTACLIAPSAHHRIMFRERDKPLIVKRGSRFALTGIALLGLAMTGAIVLVTDVIFGTSTMVSAGAGAAVLYAVLWFGLGLARKLRAARAW